MRSVRRSRAASVAVALAGVVVLGSVSPAMAVSHSGKHVLPKSVDLENALSCPKHVAVSRSTCAFSVYTNGGVAIDYLSDGKPTHPDEIANGGQSLSCPTASVCVMSAGSSLDWIRNGQVVSTTRLHGLSDWLVSCASATFCAAYGQSGRHAAVALVHEGDATASARGVSGYEVTDVSCETATKCIGTGDTTDTARSRGEYFSITPSEVSATHRVSGVNTMDHVSCGSASVCVIAGQHIASYQASSRLVIVKNGKVTNVVSGIAHPPVTISCWSSSDCMIDSPHPGANGIRDRLTHLHNGHVRGSTLLPVGAIGSTMIDCPTGSECIVAGAVGRAYYFARP